MEDFCGGETFWDTELTWSNNSWPQFTDCFQNTVLQWIPCAWLWLSATLYIYHLVSSEKNPQPIKGLLCTKLFCSLLLLLICLFEIVGAVDRIEKSQGFNDEILAPILWIATLMLHTVLVMLERSHNVIRSPVLFFYWILASVVTLIPLYSAIELKIYDTDLFRFVILCVKYATTTLCVFLNCFAAYYGEKPKGYNPEVTASLLGWISYSWLDSLMLKAFKTPLKDDDIYDLRPRERCVKVVQKFLFHWNKEKQRLLRKRIKAHNKSDHVGSKDNHVTEKTPLLSSTSKLVHNSHNIVFSTANNGEKSLKEEQSDRVKVSFITTIAKCFWLETIESQWGMVMYIAVNVVSPIVLGWLINFTKDPSERTWHGYIYGLTFIIIKMLYTTFSVKAKYLTNCLALRVRISIIAAVFRKALTMSSEARKESAVGEIVNLMSVDSGHLEMMFNYSFWVWICVVFMIIGIYLLYTIVGIALLAGLAFIVFMFTANLFVMHKMRQYQDKIMEIKDERVKIVNEVLNGIKVIKLYGWEPMFIKKIEEIRERELAVLFKYGIADGVQSFSWLVAMFWMLYFILVTFVLVEDDHYLDASTAFQTMNYIDMLKLAINVLPILMKDWVKAANSSKRLHKFLNSEDLSPDSLSRDRSDRQAVRILDADFAWEQHGTHTLKDISLSVTPGQLIAVVGMVGSGKSSLLSAMLGEMHKIKGYFNLNSSVAYVPQQAWIQNSTLKDNILFGQSFYHKFYSDVIDACSLKSDLDILPAGDKTEIGEKGINLSGGQKQRVSLARAVYSQADIYLLDDPLSAVDSHVGRHIFHNVLSKEGLLSDKTRILVTHGIQWLPEVDQIIVMNDGKISESGTYEELISHNGAFAQFLTQYLMQTETEKADDDESDELEKEIKVDMLRRLVSVTSDSDSPLSPEKPNLKRLVSHEMEKHVHHDGISLERSISQHKTEFQSRTFSELSSQMEISEKLHQETDIDGHLFAEVKTTDKSRLTSDEESRIGKVSWSVYWELVKGVGLNYSFLILVLFVCYHVLYNYTNIWIAEWNDDQELSNFTAMSANSTAREDKNTYYIGVYTGLGIGQTIFVVAYAIFLQVRHVTASRKLHKELLDCIMHAPMSFFDTTPIGRILNRFSQDIEVLDNDIFLEIEITADNALRCFGTMIIISYTMPIFLSVVLPTMILLYFIQQFYIRLSCQLRRISSNNRSPVYAHFSETLSGVSVIRAYQAQDRFIADSQDKIEKFMKPVSATKALNKWLETRLDVLNYIIVGASCIFAVLARDNLSPGLVGLAVTYALRMSSEMNTFTIIFGELENHVVSVERIREYSVVKSEAQWVSPSDDQKVDDQWPSNGQVQFVDYSTRYREGLDLVLKGLSCTIAGGEKVGIVGRTGAGKSSMVLSLFRLIEAASGRVIIDGVDISQIGLHALRRKLTILPQDPILFAGSLRVNLDPFEEKSDAELWTALEHSHLKKFVEDLPEKLDHEVGEGGENLSMGQRQLVCLARTLLRKTKILILDEATAAVDMETDDLIQKTIRSEFSGCTILTIAHRLNTVMDYDRIMVLQNGKVIEFDSPNNLLSDPNSEFFSMAKDAGLVATEGGIKV